MVSRDIRHPALSFARVFSTKEEYIGTFKCPPATFSLFLSHFFALQRYPPNFNPPRRWQRVWKVARWLRKWVIKVVEEAAVEEKDMIERRGGYARGRGRDQELEIGVHTYNDDKSYMTRSCFFRTLSRFSDPHSFAVEADLYFPKKQTDIVERKSVRDAYFCFESGLLYILIFAYFNLRYFSRPLYV